MWAMQQNGLRTVVLVCAVMFNHKVFENHNKHLHRAENRSLLELECIIWLYINLKVFKYIFNKQILPDLE